MKLEVFKILQDIQTLHPWTDLIIYKITQKRKKKMSTERRINTANYKMLQVDAASRLLLTAVDNKLCALKICLSLASMRQDFFSSLFMFFFLLFLCFFLCIIKIYRNNNNIFIWRFIELCFLGFLWFVKVIFLNFPVLIDK